MRHLITLVLIITLVGSAAAIDLGSSRPESKNNNHIGMNPGTPDGREGGEDMGSAFVINALPFNDTGNTTDNLNDYDASCPYTGSTSPDVVYSYTPSSDEFITVDLCGSGYDTKTYIMDAETNVIACNDDHYMDDICGMYVSLIENAELFAGVEYFIVIDGYGGDSGDYILNINYIHIPEPCSIFCDFVPEGEPTLGPNYDDVYNSGCGGPGLPFQELQADGNGELIFCGISGWFDYDGADYRDTDWFIAIIGEGGTVEWFLDAEYEIYGMLLGPHDCAEVGVIDYFMAGPCMPNTMIIEGDPGDVLWLWVGPTEFAAPYGFEGYEYNYMSTFNGLLPPVTASESVSFGGIKSLYR
jgi:hypothetical protein